MKYLFCLSASLLAATPALAQQDAGGDEIVVLASGFEQPADQTGQAISVVNRARIDELQSVTIADALKTLPSLSVVQSGPVGAQTSVFMRGANSSQTLVLVDGVRVNDPSSPNAAFDFGSLLAGNTQRIEVLRGPNSIIWGSQAIGGVIDIQTQRPTTALEFSGGVEGGSYGTVAGHANVSGSAGSLRYSLGGSLYHTDGFSMFSPVGNAPADDDGSREAMVNGRLTFDLAPGLQLDLRGNYINTRNSYDSAYSGGANSQAEARNKEWFAYAGLNLELADGKFHNRLGYSHADVDRVGTDPVIYSYNNYVALGLTDRIEYRGAYDLSDALQLVAGIEHEWIRSSSSYEGAPADRASNEVTGAYLQATLRPLTGLTLTGGVRHDDYTVYGGHTTLGGNAAYTPDGGITVLRATYAEGFRAPTLTEGQPPYGNTALKPETARNLDLGIERSLVENRITVAATWFHRRSTNLIVYNFDTYQSENIGRVDTDGLELRMSLRPTDRFHVEAGYALVDAFNRSGVNSGLRLERRPQHSATVTADWQTPLKLALGATLQMVGDSYSDAANTVRLDGYALVGLRASYPVTDKVEVYGRVENLTDAKYQVISGYNTPGRAAYAGVRTRF